MGPNLLFIIGTRPEAIKLWPLISSGLCAGWAQVRILSTGQHQELLDGALQQLGVRPDHAIEVMRPNQGLSELMARLLDGIDGILHVERPDAVVVQGDTTTVLSAALAAFHRSIPVAHVEAGLRTGNSSRPFPEEMNRVVVSRMARWHFAPTLSARNNLLKEGVAESDIEVSGNTGIDALRIVLQEDLEGQRCSGDSPTVLVTTHRRENFGQRLVEICSALRTLSFRHPGVRFRFPVHPNPMVGDTVRRELTGTTGIELLAPLGYREFAQELAACRLVITDSGGVQEEAPFLGKPVLVLRNETERPEAVEAGVARLVGASSERICVEVDRLLGDPDAYRMMSRGGSLFGDGHAADRIMSRLRRDLC